MTATERAAEGFFGQAIDALKCGMQSGLGERHRAYLSNALIDVARARDDWRIKAEADAGERIDWLEESR
jgi:hypothetical protein